MACDSCAFTAAPLPAAFLFGEPPRLPFAATAGGQAAGASADDALPLLRLGLTAAGGAFDATSDSCRSDAGGSVVAASALVLLLLLSAGWAGDAGAAALACWLYAATAAGTILGRLRGNGTKAANPRRSANHSLS
jgi:hypothetical protein